VDIDPWLPRAAARRPDGVALQTPGGPVSYRDLLQAATRTAGALRALGVKAGDRVALALEPGREFVEAVHGSLLLGAIAVPVDSRLRDAERAAQQRRCVAIVNVPLTKGTALFERSEWLEDDVALVVHTSGTTRRPQPVELTFGNLFAHARGVARAVELTPEDRWLNPLPLSHIGGLMAVLRCCAQSATCILEPAPFDTERVARSLGEDATLASLVPTMLDRVLEAGGTPGRQLRRILLGGGSVTRELLERARAAGFPVSQTYGLTQACSTVTLAEPGDVETAGRPLPGFGLSISRAGEIYVTGPAVAGEDVVATGDLGRLEEDGRLVVTGRKVDTIVTGGENVSPAEVEAALLEHPDVAEAAVFGRRHPQWGEAVSAKVVARPGSEPTAEALKAHLDGRLAGYKVPKTYDLVETLPRTASGKLLRRELH
jgi:O-succinylbenzoic acid--CoA ligase